MEDSEKRRKQIIESETVAMVSGLIAILTLIGYMVSLNW